MAAVPTVQTLVSAKRQKCIAVLKALTDDAAETLIIFLKLDNRQTQR